MESLLEQMLSGQLTSASLAAWVVVAAMLSVIGGALSGFLLAGRDLGLELAAFLGGVFGTTAGVPAAIAGLLLLQVL